ncbi:unnamed protein product [Nippostrongylus brasiliensis]|uniref:Chromosome transmission fidelity protein 18 homolog (inferred by orthology to a human protein) n=1 Tax=Nippostrongylus brasiliensis TaxID=27835 RepID=A0A0N4XGD2_NIPBR|nr:unnamed protein product [Nippostrongylus brasiliensis]
MMAERKEREHHRIVHATVGADESNIWVNKYSPKTYVDLLSDDGVNRNLMSWVKLWDECVFKRKIVNPPKSASAREKDMFTLDSGKPRRPVQKIVLLSGPAGMGKTTLANVVARQAGYAVVELNASDARNVPDFERALEGAVRTARTLDERARPNCLVLDEIDGAPVEAIRHLVKAVQATGRKTIRRPIICICNNMFTPALRELRAIALNIPLNPTTKERLIQRLTSIAEQEDIRIDRFALQRLVELCFCDVRFSINTLQFVSILARKEKRYVTVDDIQKAVERERVGSVSIFENWSTMLDFAHHFDNGLHANYLSVNLPLKSIRAGAEAFVHYDRIMLSVGLCIHYFRGLLEISLARRPFLESIQINARQDYSLMKYIGVFYMLLHTYIATHTRAKLKFPQMEQTANQKLRESRETLATVQNGLLGRHSHSALLYDVLPILVQIVQPTIKTMNQQLYSRQEMKEIDNVVYIMADYHLTYTPTVVNFQPQYLFQPPIDVLTMFDISDASSRNLLSNSTRQMIAEKELAAESRVEKPAAQGPKRPLLYKFNTGCSTAVKRTIRMHQLLK